MACLDSKMIDSSMIFGGKMIDSGVIFTGRTIETMKMKGLSDNW